MCVRWYSTVLTLTASCLAISALDDPDVAKTYDRVLCRGEQAVATWRAEARLNAHLLERPLCY